MRQDLESQINKINSQIASLKEEKVRLATDAEKLAKEKQRLSQQKEVAQRTVEDSENRVEELKTLEAELLKALEDANRSALSRKGNFQDVFAAPQGSEQSICRELIGWLETLDDLLFHYEQKSFSAKYTEQFVDLEDQFSRFC